MMGFCLCSHCMVAAARTRFDASDPCLNLLCLTPCAARNIIRSGYGIESNCCNDILIGTFCCPCSACQVIFCVFFLPLFDAVLSCMRKADREGT